MTERGEEKEELGLLAEHDARMEAMDEFIEWALAEWGEPSEEEKRRADEIWEQMK